MSVYSTFRPIGGQLEGRVQQFRGAAAHQHAPQKISQSIRTSSISLCQVCKFSDITRFICVDFQCLVGDGVVDPVVNVKR